MTITTEIKESLEREFNICSTTINFYKRQIKVLEKKYKMTTTSFLVKFEKGNLGDEKDFFDWYAFHKLLSNWISTKKALQPLLK
ncbi:MAG: hypothetical protein HY809_03790 [Nitrospirae bacterium]|nr:hypothetical protein [Nitrospirota bacterium]